VFLEAEYAMPSGKVVMRIGDRRNFLCGGPRSPVNSKESGAKWDHSGGRIPARRHSGAAKRNPESRDGVLARGLKGVVWLA
jgi:hypothetical protein